MIKNLGLSETNRKAIILDFPSLLAKKIFNSVDMNHSKFFVCQIIFYFKNGRFIIVPQTICLKVESSVSWSSSYFLIRRGKSIRLVGLGDLQNWKIFVNVENKVTVFVFSSKINSYSDDSIDLHLVSSLLSNLKKSYCSLIALISNFVQLGFALFWCFAFFRIWNSYFLNTFSNIFHFFFQSNVQVCLVSFLRHDSN